MTDRLLVTVIIPARNEEDDIADCLDAVASQTYPLSRIEVIVVDGASSDATPTIANAALETRGFQRVGVLRNPAGTTPSSLNLGLHEAAGDIICRVDARSLIPPMYVETCVEHLQNRAVAVVGGAQVALARGGAGAVERGIALALQHPLVMGMSRYRRRTASGPSDTVYLGAFRRSDLLAEGGWDERFVTNQDFELNRRLARRGRIWFDADLKVCYRGRRSLRQLASQYRRFGRWKSVSWFEGGVEVMPRQVMILALPPVICSVLAAGLRRRPLITTVSVGALAVTLTRSSATRSSAERLCAFAAAGVVCSAWWLGVVEQALRYFVGERRLRAPSHR